MKKRYITTTLALMLLSAAVTYGIAFFNMQKVTGALVEKFNAANAQYERIAEVRSTIETLYVNEYDENQLTEGALAGMVAYLGDRWSYYLDEESFAEYLQSLSGNMVGIGVTVVEDANTGNIRIVEVYENSPAQKSGLLPGDIVTEVDGEKVLEIGYETAVDKVRGEEGTPVRLTVMNPGMETPREITAVRAEIKVETVRSSLVDEIGYIKIRAFDLGTGNQIVTAVHNLQSQGAKGFVFDLRNNGGGALDDLVCALDALLPEGTIITATDKSGVTDEFKSDANEVVAPMAVLVNSGSISAAEFFAASLQEHGKATIIGTPTTGKGCAQRPIKLKTGGGIVLSVDKYYTAKGISLADTQGIKPDIVVELTEEQTRNFYTLTMENDPQIQAAFENVKSKITQ